MPLIGRVLGPNQAFFYRDRLERGCVILTAWVGQSPVAALCISFEAAEEGQIQRHLPNVPLLYRLYVRDDLRSRGIGSAMLKAAENVLTRMDHRKVAFGVDAHNKRAIKLYEQLGYREWPHGEVDTVREMYTIDGQRSSRPDRCLIFVKDLNKI